MIRFGRINKYKHVYRIKYAATALTGESIHNYEDFNKKEDADHFLQILKQDTKLLFHEVLYVQAETETFKRLRNSSH